MSTHPTYWQGKPPLAPRPAARPRPAWIAALLLVPVLAAAAQEGGADEDPLAELSEQVAAQQAQIDRLLQLLEAGKPAEDGGALLDLLTQFEDTEHTEHYGSTASLVTIHGFMEAAYLDPGGGDSTFDLYHANMFFAADLGDYAEAWIEIEYEHSGSAVEIDQAEIRLFGESSTLAVGRFYAPFGIERLTWYPPRSLTLSRPDAFRQVVPGSWYETGIRGEHQFQTGGWEWTAEAAVTNGLGKEVATSIRSSRQTRDNNANRAIIGRVAARPRPDLSLGVSGATMKYDDAGDNRTRLAAADVEWTPENWLVRAEAVRSFVEDPAGPVGDFHRKGSYLLVGRQLCGGAGEEDSLWLTGRWDRLDGNDRVVDAQDFHAYTLGAEWGPRENLLFRVEYRAFGDRHGSILTDDSQINLQIVIDF